MNQGAQLICCPSTMQKYSKELLVFDFFNKSEVTKGLEWH